MRPLPPVWRLPLLLLGMIALVTGVLAGLARFAVDVPQLAAAQAGGHGALMIAAFLGTVISLERAVALNLGWPYLAPLCAGLGGVALLLHLPTGVAQALFVAAGSLLSVGSVLLWRRQPTLHLAALAFGALCWPIGTAYWLIDGAIQAAVPAWTAFLVLTIAGERLELTRFLPRAPAAQRAFAIIAMLLLAAIGFATWREGEGLRLFAAALLAMALWLVRHDIARRTVRQSGLTRYIAVCLLSGYGWLAFGGGLGAAGAFEPGHAWRDAALHAIFLGFVFSMIFGHAPIIFPAVAKVRIPYHPVFYAPLVLLHCSLLVRISGDLAGQDGLARYGALANALSLLVFILTLLAALLRGRRAGEATG